MRHNMGNVERVTRFIIGTILVLASVFPIGAFTPGLLWFSSLTTLVLFVIGLVIDTTAFASYCPLNALVHLNTCTACRVGETHAHRPV